MKSIIGQNKSIKMLQHQLKVGLNHAYLFLGPDGVGKYTTAVKFAQNILCELKNGCGECRPCNLLASSNNPDFITVQPTGEIVKSIKINQVRNIISLAQTEPYQGDYRVFIINEAHLMNIQAINCLLKTLEEPFPGNIFILTSPVVLIPTVMSRVQTVNFRRLTVKEIEDGLVRQGYNSRYAVLADGSLGKAVELATDGVVDIKDILGIKSVFDALAVAEEVSKDKETAIKKLTALLYWFRDMLYCKETSEVITYPDQKDKIVTTSENITSTEIANRLKKVSQAIKYLQANGNTKLILEDTFLALI